MSIIVNLDVMMAKIRVSLKVLDCQTGDIL